MLSMWRIFRKRLQDLGSTTGRMPTHNRIIATVHLLGDEGPHVPCVDGKKK